MLSSLSDSMNLVVNRRVSLAPIGSLAARAGGHILHIGSSLGQLDGIALDGVTSYIRGAKSLQEIIDMPYPAEDLEKVRSSTVLLRRDQYSLLGPCVCKP